MDWTAAFLLFFTLLDHLHNCVFLLPARTVNGTPHIVSSLCNISIFVSMRYNNIFTKLTEIKFYIFKMFFLSLQSVDSSKDACIHFFTKN